MKRFPKSIAMMLLFALLVGLVSSINTVKTYAASSQEDLTLQKNDTEDEVTITFPHWDRTKKYIIQMKSDSQSRLKKIKTIKETGKETYSYTVKNLEPGTYSFRIKYYDGYYYSYSKTKRISLGLQADENCVLINSETFPDDVFRGWVLDNIDKNKDGQLSEKEINKVKEIVIDVKKTFLSLKGIEVFTSLKKLDVGKWGYLGKLDLTQNTKLEEIYCSDSYISKLKIGNNPNLRILDCSKNKDMKSLDLKYATGLEKLDCNRCERLETLTIKNCSALVELNCQECNLYSLDIKKCTSLKDVNLRYNNYLSEIDFSGNKNMTRLRISFSGLKSLDLSKNTALIEVFYSYDQKRMLERSNCKADQKNWICDAIRKK